jgi:glyoxylase-like metal-dependent hydrolase (beta-lactamase superfamily II)
MTDGERPSTDAESETDPRADAGGLLGRLTGDGGLSRRDYVVSGAAGLLGVAGLSGTATARSGRSAQCTSCRAAASHAAQMADPEIPEKGYLVEEIKDGLYWITEGTYNHIFLTTGEGVIVVDAPPTIGEDITSAIREVTDEPITHVVYSHYHADHVGAASIYPDDAEYIAFTETANYLDRFGDENRPTPTTVFGPKEVVGRSNGRGSDASGDAGGRGQARDDDRTRVVGTSYTVEVGDQELRLDYRGANHSLDNLFVYAPAQEVLMLVDVIYPGWVPFKNLGVSSDIPGYIRAHDQALEYEFETFVGGHLTRLGTREDVEAQREFIADLRSNAETAIETVEIGPIVQELGADAANPWVLFDAYLDELTRVTADATLEKWGDRLRGTEVYTDSNAFSMAESLRIDFGKLGPFGL